MPVNAPPGGGFHLRSHYLLGFYLYSTTVCIHVYKAVIFASNEKRVEFAI